MSNETTAEQSVAVPSISAETIRKIEGPPPGTDVTSTIRWYAVDNAYVSPADVVTHQNMRCLMACMARVEEKLDILLGQKIRGHAKGIASTNAVDPITPTTGPKKKTPKDGAATEEAQPITDDPNSLVAPPKNARAKGTGGRKRAASSTTTPKQPKRRRVLVSDTDLDDEE